MRSSSTLKSGKDVFPCNHFFVKMHIKTFLFLFPRLSELPSIMDARVYKMIGVQLPPIQIITVFLTNSNTLNGCPKPSATLFVLLPQSVAHVCYSLANNRPLRQSLSVYNLLLDLLSLTHRNQTGRYQASHMNIIRTYISSRALTFQTSCFYLIQWKDFKNDEKRLFHVQNSFRSQNI